MKTNRPAVTDHVVALVLGAQAFAVPCSELQRLEALVQAAWAATLAAYRSVIPCHSPDGPFALVWALLWDFQSFQAHSWGNVDLRAGSSSGSGCLA